MQKIIVMTTNGEGLRSDAVAWSAEDGDEWRPGPIGLTPWPKWPHSFGTPLEAIGRGWRLMAPPTSHDVETATGSRRTEWEWWFTRD